MLEKIYRIIPLLSSLCILFGVTYEYGYFSNIDLAIFGLFSVGEIVSGAIRWMPTVSISVLVGFFISMWLNFSVNEDGDYVFEGSRPLAKWARVSEVASFIFVFLVLCFIHFSFPPGYSKFIFIYIIVIFPLAFLIPRIDIFRKFINTPMKFLFLFYFISMIIHSYTNGLRDFHDDVKGNNKYIVFNEEKMPVVRIMKFGTIVVKDGKILMIKDKKEIIFFNHEIDISKNSVACRNYQFFCGTIFDVINYRNSFDSHDSRIGK